MFPDRIPLSRSSSLDKIVKRTFHFFIFFLFLFLSRASGGFDDADYASIPCVQANESSSTWAFICACNATITVVQNAVCLSAITSIGQRRFSQQHKHSRPGNSFFFLFLFLFLFSFLSESERGFCWMWIMRRPHPMRTSISTWNEQHLGFHVCTGCNRGGTDIY